jgi:murein DD-endopeptidase MepM/ murein hydrolase activator NlpD
MYKSGRGPFLAIVLLLFLPVGVVLLLLQRRWQANRPPIQNINRATPIADIPASPGPGAFKETPESASPAVVSEVPTPPPTPDQLQPLSQIATGYVGKLYLIIPVLGINQAQLRDTFGDSRSEGRVHDAIDIPAPLGTPVIAAADGEIIRLFESELGGITIYQFSSDKKLVYYYAHLQRYADQLTAGKFVRQGETIAYVGDTGNAGTGNFHLHFSIAVVSDPTHYWEGENINPYPLLRR